MCLVHPSLSYANEIMAYRSESLELDPVINGSCDLSTYEDPAAWIAHCEVLSDPETLPADCVEADEWLTVNDDQRILGMVNIRRHIRHDFLAEYVGHIGYSIRPSERGRGYAELQLRLALAKCRELGLTAVLLTCDADNESSRRTILSCGGVFERTAIQTQQMPQPRLRYWISL